MNTTIWIWHHEYDNMNMAAGICKYEYDNTNMTIWIWQYEYDNMNMTIWIGQYEYNNMNMTVMPGAVRQILEFVHCNIRLRGVLNVCNLNGISGAPCEYGVSTYSL